MMAMTQLERLAILETKLDSMKDDIESYVKADLEAHTNLTQKLDTLLELKAKGTGAFALVSLIVGSGLVSLVMLLISWLKS